MNMLLCHDQEFLPIDFYAGELDTSSKTLRRDLEQVQKDGYCPEPASVFR